MAHHHDFHAKKNHDCRDATFLSFSSGGGGVGQGKLVNASQLPMQACDKNTVQQDNSPEVCGNILHDGKGVVFIFILSI